MPVRQGQTLRFGPFSLDPRCGELRTNGTRLKLQGQPIQILELLLEKPGELVTREEIRQKLWSSDTFVDFDHNLNTAIKKLRQALGDEADTPKYIETLPRYGYRFIGEVTQEDDRQPTAPANEPSPEHESKQSVSTPRILISAGLLATFLLSAFLIYRWPHSRPSEASRTPIRSQLQLRGAHPGALSLSNDGQYLLYVGGPKNEIWIRDLLAGTDEPLAGTENAFWPFWSPDRRYIGFFTDTPRKLKKIALDSRIITEICDLDMGKSSWGTSNVILISHNPVGVKAVSVETGRIRVLSKDKGDWLDTFPIFLPDGNHYLFVRIDKNRYATRGASGTLFLAALDGTAPRSLNTRVIDYAEYAAEYVVYNTQNGVFAQKFDMRGLQLLGRPSLIIPFTGTGVRFTASGNGTLVSRPTLSQYQGETELRLYRRTGQQLSESFAQGYPDQPRFSPDGKHIAYDQVIGDYRDIWIYDLERRVNTRLTPGDSLYLGPVWSPDGKRIAYRYAHAHTRGIAVRNVDGSGQPEILFENTNDDPLSYSPRSWSSAGDCLFITVAEIPNGLRKIGVLCLSGDRKVTLLPAPKNSSRIYPIISPDGKWLAYSSNEAGANKIFVEPYPGNGENTLVSGGYGAHPQWRGDGRELFFFAGDKVQALSINYTGQNVKVGSPTPLFSFPPPFSHGSPFDPSPDGHLFVVNAQRVPLVPSDTVDLITNFDLIVKK